MRGLILGATIFLSCSAIAQAETLEGKIASISVDDLKLILEDGTGLNFSDALPIEGLAIGQTVSVDIIDGTVTIASVTVLAEPEPEPVLDDLGANSTGDSGTLDDAGTQTLDTTSGEGSPLDNNDDLSTVTDGSSVDYSQTP